MTNSHGEPGDRAADLAVFDRLPRSVKELLWEAPDSISAASVDSTRRRWSLDPSELADEYRERIRNYTIDVIRQTYGPLHPQLRELTK